MTGTHLVCGPSRSEWYGPLPWQTQLRPAEPPEGVPGALSGHGECQPGPVPASEPPTGSQGEDGPQVTHDRHVQEDAGVGCQCHHHRLRSVSHPADHPAHRRRPQLYLLVLERLL